MTVKTDVLFFDKDVGKNLYRKKTYYTICIEQDVLANSEDEAEQKFLDHGGIEYDEIKSSLTSEFDGIETYTIDCNYQDGETAKVIGKVDYDPDDEFAKEDGFVDVVPV